MLTKLGLALAIAHSLRERLPTRHLTVAAVVWLTLWSSPSIPAPGAWFYLVFGGMILVGIALKLLQPQRAHSVGAAGGAQHRGHAEHEVDVRVPARVEPAAGERSGSTMRWRPLPRME